MMNKAKYITIITLLLSFSMVKLWAQEPVHITGKISNFPGVKVKLVGLKGPQRTQDVQVAADGSFEVSCVTEPTTTYMSFDDTHNIVRLYLEPGTKIDLQIVAREIMKGNEKAYELDVEYTGDNKECYEFLKKIDGQPLGDVLEGWEWDRLPQVSFSEYRESLRQRVDHERLKVMELPNTNLRTMMLNIMERNLITHCMRYSWVDKNDDKVFLDWINSIDRNNPENKEFARGYIRWYQRHHKDMEGKTFAGYTQILDKVFISQQMRNIFATEYVSAAMRDINYPDKDKLYADYKAYCNDADEVQKVNAYYERYKNVGVGTPFVHFTMRDTKDKEVKIESLKGKYLYIDCWATWCGPCCAETPFMEKLYNHYAKDKRIELVSISLDTSKRSWLNKLAAEKPKWKQYIIPENFKSPLCTSYDITGIPRFILLDDKGKIVSINAPRPSNEKIIEWLESMMK